MNNGRRRPATPSFPLFAFSVLLLMSPSRCCLVFLPSMISFFVCLQDLKDLATTSNADRTGTHTSTQFVVHVYLISSFLCPFPELRGRFPKSPMIVQSLLNLLTCENHFLTGIDSLFAVLLKVPCRGHPIRKLSSDPNNLIIINSLFSHADRLSCSILIKTFIQNQLCVIKISAVNS